jgi:Domain of unknown function (DUF305)
MTNDGRQRSIRLGLVGLLLVIGLGGMAAPSALGSSTEGPFLAENQAAMDKMMAGMAIHPSGDVDEDFAAMMIPHHQGAIDMAKAELRYGHNEQLRRLAQEIIVDQQQEIAAMSLATGKPLPPSVAAPTQPAAVSAPGAAPSDAKGKPQ